MFVRIVFAVAVAAFTAAAGVDKVQAHTYTYGSATSASAGWYTELPLGLRLGHEVRGRAYWWADAV